MSNLSLQAGQLSSCYEGLLLEGGAAPITNVSVAHVSVSQANQHTFAFASPADGATFQGITLRLNFLLTSGFMAPSQPSSGVLFRGGAPRLRRAQAIFQAIDPAQFLTVTRFVAAAARTSGPVSGFALRSDCWNGGYVRPGAQVAGAFRDSFFRLFFSDAVGGDVFDLAPGSANNWLSKSELAVREHPRGVLRPPLGCCPHRLARLVRHPALLASPVTPAPAPAPCSQRLLEAGARARHPLPVPGRQPKHAAAACAHGVCQRHSAPGTHDAACACACLSAAGSAASMPAAPSLLRTCLFRPRRAEHRECCPVSCRALACLSRPRPTGCRARRAPITSTRTLAAPG